MSKPLIQLDSVCRWFTNGEVVTRALNGVSLTLEREEFVAIMGPSGSGKSTLMHIMGFLDVLTDGTYVFGDKDVSQLDEDELAFMRRENVGFVFQAFNLLPRQTVRQNVLLPSLYHDTPVKVRERRVEEVVESVGLSHRLDYQVNRLSGGEKQRVAIARALINDPAVIFADEPTGNLDTVIGSQVLQLLVELNNQGRTIVMVTHEQEAAEYGKRIIRLRDGVLESDTHVKKRRNGTYLK